MQKQYRRHSNKLSCTRSCFTSWCFKRYVWNNLWPSNKLGKLFSFELTPLLKEFKFWHYGPISFDTAAQPINSGKFSDRYLTIHLDLEQHGLYVHWFWCNTGTYQCPKFLIYTDSITRTFEATLFFGRLN